MMSWVWALVSLSEVSGVHGLKLKFWVRVQVFVVSIFNGHFNHLRKVSETMEHRNAHRMTSFVNHSNSRKLLWLIKRFPFSFSVYFKTNNESNIAILWIKYMKKYLLWKKYRESFCLTEKHSRHPKIRTFSKVQTKQLFKVQTEFASTAKSMLEIFE